MKLDRAIWHVPLVILAGLTGIAGVVLGVLNAHSAMPHPVG